MFLTFKFYQRIKIIAVEYYTQGEYTGETNADGEVARINVDGLV